MTFETVALHSGHNRRNFACGKEPLDRYFQFQVTQDIKRRLCACFVYADDRNLVLGYYTLSNACIPRNIIPELIRKKMPPSYTNLPVTLLGRLAVDKDHLGKRIGELLLIDAMKKAFVIAATIGSMAVIVDPLDEDAAAFYKKYGFIELPDSRKMFLPMKTIAALL